MIVFMKSHTIGSFISGTQMHTTGSTNGDGIEMQCQCNRDILALLLGDYVEISPVLRLILR
jgi:hypothetical protein